MSLFLRILIGIAIASGGAFMVIKTSLMLEWFGHIGWAEEKLGGGGSVLLYKTIGLIACFVGFMVATDLWDAFLMATLGSFLPKSL